MATDASFDLPTEAEIYDHIDSIPAKLRRCAAGDHNWDMTSWVGYTPSGKQTKDPNRAASFDITDTCVVERGGQRGCGEQRHYQAAKDLTKISEYTYSNHNPLVVSPRGISFTGISKRSAMPAVIRRTKIFKPRIHLAPTGTTKRALKSVKSA
ncbi:hypothetical protein [Streptomyces sp. NPDC001089]